MTIKLLILKTGENIISKVKEGHLEDKFICYVLENPCIISYNSQSLNSSISNKLNIILQCWPILSKDTTVELPPDSVITIVEPKDEVKNIYETQVLEIEKNEINQIDLLDESASLSQPD
jgi:hypothetical protein